MGLIRSFIALPIPPEIQSKIRTWMASWRDADPGVRWARPEGLHVTLKFLGDVEEGRLGEFFEKIPQLLSDAQPITLGIGGLGQFPTAGSPRVLWAGIHGDTQPLAELAGSLNAFFAQHGFEPEARPYSPHLTLARAKQAPSPGFLKRWKELGTTQFGRFTARELNFYRSELTRERPVYTLVRSFYLERENQNR